MSTTTPIPSTPTHIPGYTLHNLNDRVKVKPTELGLTILRNRQRDLLAFLFNQIHPDGKGDFEAARRKVESMYTGASSRYVPDADGYIIMQLWEVMEVFGSHMGMGAGPHPIDMYFHIETEAHFAKEWYGVTVPPPPPPTPPTPSK